MLQLRLRGSFRKLALVNQKVNAPQERQKSGRARFHSLQRAGICPDEHAVAAGTETGGRRWTLADRLQPTGLVVQRQP